MLFPGRRGGTSPVYRQARKQRSSSDSAKFMSPSQRQEQSRASLTLSRLELHTYPSAFNSSSIFISKDIFT